MNTVLPPRRGAGRTLLCCAALLAGVACVSDARLFEKIDRRVGAGDFAAAAALLEDNEHLLYGKRNAFLYHLELGMLLHLAGEYAESNLMFERAKRIGEAHFTKSVSAHAASFLTNELVRAYPGENFEHTLVHIFSALNYEMLGDTEEAIVEARQLDLLFAKLETDLGQKNVYRDDAFARFLSAMLFESRGNWSDARIAYWKALEAYEVYEREYGVATPAALLPAALAVAQRLGPGAVQKMEERWGKAEPRRLDPGHGEVVVLHYNGWVPRKGETFLQLSFGESWTHVDAMQPNAEERTEVDSALAGAHSVAADQMLRIAFPTHLPTSYAIARMDLSSESARRIGPTELVEDIGAIARKDLEDRLGRIRAKAIARAAVKLAFSIAVCETAAQGDTFTAVVVCGAAQAARLATERADTRSWRNLPDQIWMSFSVLPAGTHDLSLDLRDRAGEVVSRRRIDAVQVKAGRRTFVIVRTTQ